MCYGDAQVSNHLGHFHLFDSFFEVNLQVHWWVSSGGHSDHSPTILDLVSSPKNPPGPFKLNPCLMEELSFIEVTRSSWMSFNPNQLESPSLQFLGNIKRAK
jgi:hypothetical protein